MGNNWYQQPVNNNSQQGDQNTARPSSLLRDYAPRQQNNNVPPSSSPAAPAVGNPYSPMPSQRAPVPQMPAPPQPMSPQPPQYPQFPGGERTMAATNWIANTMQTVRQWSGKFTALGRNTVYEPPAPPMVLYRPQVPMPEIPIPQPERKPWKRSRTIRIARQMRKRRERWTHGRPTIGKIIGGVFLALMLLTIIVSSSSVGYAFSFYQQNLPIVQNIANMQVPQTTRIYDRNMNLLYEKSYDGGRRTPVSYDAIPKVMQDAMIAAEDKTFWTNSGIDPVGISRAATEFVSNGGQINGGGSTLTQQIVKNLTNSTAGTLERKIIEASLAIGLTQQYDKKKILEMYLNVAPFGTQDLGIEAAVQDYFGLKPECDKNFKCVPAITKLDYDAQTKKRDPYLALARATMLAGIPQNPNWYDPTLGDDQKKAMLVRQEYVLDQMMDMKVNVKGIGVVTPEVKAKVKEISEKMTFKRYQVFLKAPHFSNWIISELITALGEGNDELGATRFITGGFNIRTTIDPNLQTYVENAVKRHLTEPAYQPFRGVTVTLNQNNNINTAAVVVMNAKTGEILAMNGSLDYFMKTEDKQLEKRVSPETNVAVTPREPGSTFKPFVYATAFQMGWYPGLVLPDFKTYFPNGASAGTPVYVNGKDNKDGLYVPTDYGEIYNNQNSSIRSATANSFNIPAVKALAFTGVENVANTVRRMGITGLDQHYENAPDCKPKNPNITLEQCVGISSLVLGSVSVSPLEMTGAYQVFANQGVRVPPQGILDIWDNYGHNLYHYDAAKVKGEQVFSPQISYMMTSILADEGSRSFEFPGVHTLSFWDIDPTCRASRKPEPDCLQNQVAAKTGTSDGFRDNWTIGYTPNVVVGVWSGNANGEFMTNNPTGIMGAAPIWQSVISFATGICREIDNIPCTDFNPKAVGLGDQGVFTKPDGLLLACVSPIDGLAPRVGGKNNNKNNNGDDQENAAAVTTNCAQKDWMLPGMVPLQVGIGAVDTGKDDNKEDEGDNKDDKNNKNDKNNNNGNGNEGSAEGTSGENATVQDVDGGGVNGEGGNPTGTGEGGTDPGGNEQSGGDGNTNNKN